MTPSCKEKKAGDCFSFSQEPRMDTNAHGSPGIKVWSGDALAGNAAENTAFEMFAGSELDAGNQASLP